MKAWVRQLRNAFPDARATIEHMVAEGDMLAVHYRMTGTHEGAFGGIPASGNVIDAPGVDLVRIVDGKAVEHWGVVDNATLLSQLGAMGAPGTVATPPGP